jgi:hypothetical protein
MQAATAAPIIAAALRTTRVALRLDGELHERLTGAAHAHGYADLEDSVLDVLTETGNEHRDCRRCRRVARGGRPAPAPAAPQMQRASAPQHDAVLALQ